ncbi:MAG: hypothetical protein HOP07_14820 [Bacteriovoracaceae bacterium]|nr:hypothetical protein [Bacteriovoracaceae bacterium]
MAIKKKAKKYNSDFFTNAKKVVGAKRFKEAIHKADERIKSLSKKTLKLIEEGLTAAREGRFSKRKFTSNKKIVKKKKSK